MSGGGRFEGRFMAFFGWSCSTEEVFFAGRFMVFFGWSCSMEEVFFAGRGIYGGKCFLKGGVLCNYGIFFHFEGAASLGEVV